MPRLASLSPQTAVFPMFEAAGNLPELWTSLEQFNEFGRASVRLETASVTNEGSTIFVPTWVNEFWTSKQRAAHSLHEISYRACFKPQLPRFFIERLTQPGGVVYDPFMGRGTTILESALLGRIPFGTDLNPLSQALIRPRLQPPSLDQVKTRLAQIPFHDADESPEELLAFYHPETLLQICALKKYLLQARKNGADTVDEWINLVGLNRLTGHSPGFFSVYTLPPNQAVSVRSQLKINARRNQKPPVRDVAKIILKKTRGLLADCDAKCLAGLEKIAARAKFFTASADHTPQLKDSSVDLVVTSPPFLNVVDYATDNWLRCWFLGIDASQVELTVPRRLDRWQESMTAVFRELYRVLKPGGHVAFEVGEVHGGTLKLDAAVLPCGVAAGFQPRLVLVNDQEFTKTANCWGVSNNAKGTNTNRIVVFRK